MPEYSHESQSQVSSIRRVACIALSPYRSNGAALLRVPAPCANSSVRNVYGMPLCWLHGAMLDGRKPLVVRVSVAAGLVLADSPELRELINRGTLVIDSAGANG